MRLVLQCTLCGTVQPVGAAVCSACRADGVENLRLMFECQHCFRLGLNPACDLCSSFLSLDDDPMPESEADAILAEEVLEGDLMDEELDDLEDDLGADFATGAKGAASVFDLPREGFLLAELDDDELDEEDPIREGE